MKLVGASGQQTRHPFYDASGTIGTGGTPQLLLPVAKSRSMLLVMNLSTAEMFIEFGAARATCSLTNGKVTGFSITNAGFGYTVPPVVELLGGGDGGNPSYLGVGQAGYPAPGDAGNTSGRWTDLSGKKPAKAHAVLTGGAVTSFEIEDPGAGYAAAPYVFMTNDLRDPIGAAIPSATSGIWVLSSGGSYYVNGTACPTDQVSIFCATGSTAFACKWMD
ncbi:MAG TPA: hypothetical protein VN663_22960 [Ramlibacter sp.]|nr:hypothetical protein [Ramlibacter sp.]